MSKDMSWAGWNVLLEIIETGNGPLSLFSWAE